MGSFLKKCKISYVMFSLIVLCALAFGFYRFYWMQRPMYAVTEIFTAVRKGDAVTFTKFVDLDSVYGHVYDDTVKFLVKQNESSVNNPKWLSRKLTGNLAVTVLKTFRPDVVTVLSEMTVRNIVNRQLKGDTVSSEIVTQKGMSGFFVTLADIVAEQNDFKHLDAVSIDVNETVEGKAQGYVKFVSRETQKPFTLQFAMIQYPSGTWKVTQILNFDEMLERVKSTPLPLDDILR